MSFRISGRLPQVRAVLEALAAIGERPTGCWRCRCSQPCQLDTPRGSSVGPTWRRAVELALLAPVPLSEIRVGPWGRW